ncbi:CRISPR-associated protein Cas4 [Halocatena salina]|uniref:PD-(D/E)XK nuclease family protein n=1 Tax=Halocatena salina TaxID=2934340 RepID=A0A8U0A2Y9_9EURY|nr:PD-(D/E)XK nuclease family protein [Halocatena salina]UPM43159.1 PD-(D/E)XK nuclease family protein [Halocatena salina]
MESIDDGSTGRERSVLDELLAALSETQFQHWYKERQYRKNIEEGTPHYNESGFVPSPERHSPSKLLQCHRKITYQQCNAPAEQPEPKGIFWFGAQFETEIAIPFLRYAATEQSTYVRNTDWIEYSVDTVDESLEIKGSTDPVIVDSGAVPLLPTEIKTKQSLNHVSSPMRHHTAQLHAYMVGLSEKYDIDLTTGLIVYGSRESLEIQTFEIEFNERFWNDVVLDWATDHTKHRLQEDLPPAKPESNWECKFCSYRERCGKGTTSYDDAGVSGFLPGFTGYPRARVIEYLEGNPDAVLTPALALQYPDLAERYEVADWYCDACSSRIEWDVVTSATEPLCPHCAEEGELTVLSRPPQQHQVDE